MVDLAQLAQDEFWRPPMPAVIGVSGPGELVDACDRCGTEFIVDSRFCHTCGAGRAGLHPSASAQLRERFNIAQFIGMVEKLGLSTAAFIAFGLGVLCLVGAVGVGIIFSARTMLDWQAVQLWRIEWLLAAVAAFVAGCLLKKAH